MNNCVFIGRLVRDPELRYTGTGQPVTNFSIAVPKAKGVVYLRGEVWDTQAENLAKFCIKGQKIAIAGKLDIDVWEDKSKVKHTIPKIVCHNIEYLEKPRGTSDTKEHHEEPSMDECPM